jgi:hypothetical protein
VVVFFVFCLGYVSDRASFTTTKIEAYKTNFEQNIWEYYGFILTPRNGIYNFEGVESLRLCLQHELVLLLSYKINSKYTGITVTGRIFSGNLKK